MYESNIEMNIIKPIHSDYQSFPRFQSMVNQLKETIQINGIPKKQEDTEYLMKLIDSFMPNYTENGYNPDTGRFVQISFSEKEIRFSWTRAQDFLTLQIE